MVQLSFANISPKKKSKLRAERFLNEMKTVIPWRKITNLIKPHYYNNQKGRCAYDLLLMFKIHCLQQWYNLGDQAMEEAIYDRRSFADFLDLDLIKDSIPDETTILKFRHLLEDTALTMQIFHMINTYLESKGMLLREGTIVDATIINSTSSTKNKDKKRDPEMSHTKKNNSYHFGMKVHVGVDHSSGIVHSCAVTTAKVSDRERFPALLHGLEKAIFGDKGYVNKEEKKQAREEGIFWGIEDRGSNVKKISNKQKRRNRRLSKIRAKVEHPFRVIKHLWGHRKTRYRGIKKNGYQFLMLLGLSNLYMNRRKLLQES